jgi:DNA-binding response OmpR family regulator
MTQRILLVDDEPGIRETLSQILIRQGFEVSCKATVAEALAEISVAPFDVLLSDLNIGQPGDGFTVVSAMRRTQPNCINLILTGYPAFESALQAIRDQVDDYLVKPARVEELIATIKRHLQSRGQRRQHAAPGKRIAEVIHGNVDSIVARTLLAMKTRQEVQQLSLTDEQLIFPFAPLLRELAKMLESESDELLQSTLDSAAMRGHIHCLQGYSAPALVTTLCLLQKTIYVAINENLLALDISKVIPDISRMQNSIALQLEETLRAYLHTRKRRLVFQGSGDWKGWYCDRCCWNLPARDGEMEGSAIVTRAELEFAEHDCERSAREGWNEKYAKYAAA